MWSYREYIKAAKNDGLCEELLSENDFADALATFSCYNRGVTTGRGGGGGGHGPSTSTSKANKVQQFQFQKSGILLFIKV